MDEDPIKLENILEQASKWTFAGDFTLLQWMKQISQDLESRGIKTTEALTKLDNNVKSTNIALDNVANSLTTLQFGNQFVECRVQDDDDIHVNTNEASKDVQKEDTTTSEEMLNMFLENNLKVLRNCYEKYSIDLEDSDDEEGSKEKTCIYKPINPYNERPLPYIFGSKEWHSKWHVGLYENQQDNSYSGDEISEAFSESSSASHLGDNESFESNTEWASNNSIENDHLNANIEIKNASSLRGSQSLYPGTHIPINAARNEATIDESSSTSSSLTKKPLTSIKRNEHITQRSESTNSISSKSSSQITAKVSTVNNETASQYKAQPQKFVDLFEEPPEDPEFLKSLSVSSTLNKIAAADDNQSVSSKRSSAYKTQPTSSVDLFAETPDDIKSSMSSNQHVKRKTINLFEEDENHTAKDDLLSVLTQREEFEKPKNNILIQERTNVTNEPSTVSKFSLFDDSDDDDDFLKAFVKRSSDKEATKSTLSKSLFFDNEACEPTISSILLKTDEVNGSDMKTTSKEKHFDKKIQNIFGDNDSNEDLLFHQTKRDESKFQIPNPEQQVKTSVSASKLQAKSSAKENIKTSENVFQDFNDVPKIDNSNEDKIAKSKNLFDDLDDDDDDLFSFKPKKQSQVFQQSSIKDERKESSFKENEEKSFEISKDTAVSTEVDKIIQNQLIDTSYSKDNISSDNREDNNKSKQIVAGDHSTEQTIASEIIENKLDTKLNKVDNNLFDKKQLFEAPNPESNTQHQKDENKHNATTTIPDKSALNPDIIVPKPTSSNNYEFNSVLFLDEPPEDDNEFFETLAKTPNTLNSNYNTIDLENDVYEPELPKVPVASTSTNQADTSDNFYTGLQLFSDIPPDDDAGSCSEISTLHPDTNKTNRLHSVFYDDFNETLMALNQKHAEKEISSNHSVFNNEPPPMTEEELNSTSKDIMYHRKVPDNKQDITYFEHKAEGFDIANQLEKSLNESNTQFSNKRPVSKLQMPDININVQALLPGANISICKTKESSSQTKIFHSDQDITEPKEIVTENKITTSTAMIPRNNETKHILPSLTKNRVKASSARRPSTRKARQESYRKSLFEQQQTLGGGDENVAIQKENAQTDIFEETPRQVVVNKQFPEDTTIVKDKVFEIYEGKVQNNENPKSSLLLNKMQNEEHLSSSKQLKSINESSENNEANLKPEQKRSLLLFADEEEDDDFFKHIRTSKNIEADKTIIPKVKQETVATISPAETGEKNVSSSSALLANKINAVTKDIQVSTSKDAEVPSAINKSVTATEEYKKPQQPSKETENSFNNFNVGATANVKNTKKILNESKSFLDEEDDDDDLFKSPLQQQTKSNKNKENINKAKLQFKSFLDSESEDELTVAGLQQGISTQSIGKSLEKIPNVNTSMPKNTNAKLFENSESDSDDLFGNFSSSKTITNKISSESLPRTQTKAHPQPSLFGDESDSDDFLMHSGSAKKHTVPKNAIKKKEPKTASQTNASLFSDLDSDEDDLFSSSGAAKVKTSNVTNIPNVKASSISKPTAAVADISKSKSVDDNPLADLL